MDEPSPEKCTFETYQNLSYRRRELFPSSQYHNNDELGNISPLSTDSFENSYSVNENVTESSFIKFRNSTLHDYEVLGSIYPMPEDSILDDDAISNSNGTSDTFNGNKDLERPIVPNETPKCVPNLSQKTPEDASTTSSNAPKLYHRSPFVEHSSCSQIQSGKRKFPMISPSPPSKRLQMDHLCKVRTALFSQSNPTVPVSAFYSDSKIGYSHFASKSKATHTNVKKSKSSSLYLCNRKVGKNRSGGINAGVSHKIRKYKPKPKKIVNDMENCTAPLLEYLNDLRDMSCQVKQIQEIKKVDYIQPVSILSESNISSSKGNAPNQNKRKHGSLSDSNKKFFKHRTGNVTFTVDKRVKFVVDDGKLTLLGNKVSNNPLEHSTDIKLASAELEVFDHEDLINPDEVESIIFNLSKDDEDLLQLQPYSALPKREYSMDFNNVSQLTSKHNNANLEENSMLLSPTTQMCNMTSGLALNSSHQGVRNLTDILNKENSSSTVSGIEKENLYPIFYGPNNPPPKPTKSTKPSTLKKMRPLPKDQMLLDVGQKKFGAAQCAECKFVYHMGDANDELMHQNYHSATSIFRFGGWKDEQIMGHTENARIIRVLPCHPKPWLKKVKDLLDVVNRDLGYYDMDIVLDNTQVYLYITHKTIVGCLVVEPKSVGHQMLSDDTGIDLCSELSYPIKCGISRVWVAPAHRQRGIGTALLNCLRANFFYGSVLNESDIAFSSPTVAGKSFAAKYFNTPNFLVYFS